MIVLSLSLLVLCNGAFALSLPGPLVYVVTPASRPELEAGRSAPRPFYYHNWIRRMDDPLNATTTPRAPPPSLKTPDLIFAEFESDKMKHIRKLLEKERIDSKTTTTTSIPIYVPDIETQEPSNVHQGAPSEKKEVATQEKDMTDYFALYNNMYDNDNVPLAPVYMPKTSSTTQRTTTKSVTTTTPMPPPQLQNVQSIWHIIDSQKQDQYAGKWNEVHVGSDAEKGSDENHAQLDNKDNTKKDSGGDEGGLKIDDDFVLPGLGTTSGIGGENESRAIRTEPNIRFPYVNLKPYQMNNLNKPMYDVTNSKKGNNNMFSLDNFAEVKLPVRGEVNDVPDMVPMRQPIDRYNPAQPYLPSEYGKNKQSYKPSSTPMKAVANLVPPPPPLPPKITDDDFPPPSTYEQFPPFAPSASDTAPPPPPSKPTSYQPPMDAAPDSGPGPDSDDGPPIDDLGYRYKAPSPPSQNFLPTLPPLKKPFGGYFFDKPPVTAEAPPTDSDFQGYHYEKPVEASEKPVHSGYHYSQPEPDSPPKDVAPPYGHHDHHEEYPELIYDKPGHGMGDTKPGDDMKNDDDSMGMAPPPMADPKPGGSDDSGFPHDFPVDFKYHHDFDEHDFHHYHHHHPTTTTTTTEMPRVNRYSYYYLGKKLYYLPLYFSVYFIIYVGALIIKAVLRHKIVYPNSWRPNDQTASFFTKRSADNWDSHENLHELTGRVTRAIAAAAERYMARKKEKED